MGCKNHVAEAILVGKINLIGFNPHFLFTFCFIFYFLIEVVLTYTELSSTNCTA